MFRLLNCTSPALLRDLEKEDPTEDWQTAFSNNQHRLGCMSSEEKKGGVGGKQATKEQIRKGVKLIHYKLMKTSEQQKI